MTLVERAGQVAGRHAAAPPSALPINHAVKAVTAAGVRNNNISLSASTRHPPTFTARAQPNASFASSVSGYSRPAASQVQRPQTSMSQSRTNKPGAPGHVRSASALDGSSLEDGFPLGKRKGKVPVPVSSQQSLARSKSICLPRISSGRDHYEKRPSSFLSVWQSALTGRTLNHPLKVPQQRELLPRPTSELQLRGEKESARKCLLSTAFKGLSLGTLANAKEEGPGSDSKGEEPNIEASVSETNHFPSYTTHSTSYKPLSMPSQSIFPFTSRGRCTHRSTTPHSHFRKRHRTPEWQKGDFLRKDSSTRSNFRAAWDTKGRLEDMELLYSRLKEQMEGTTFERNSLLEIVDLQRTRRELLFLFFRFNQPSTCVESICHISCQTYLALQE